MSSYLLDPFYLSTSTRINTLPEELNRESIQEELQKIERDLKTQSSVMFNAYQLSNEPSQPPSSILSPFVATSISVNMSIRDFLNAQMTFRESCYISQATRSFWTNMLVSDQKIPCSVLKMTPVRHTELQQLGNYLFIEKSEPENHSENASEAKILSGFRHPSIVALLGVDRSSSNSLSHPIQIEFGGISLGLSYQKAEPDELKKWIKEVLSALEYLAAKDIVHHNLKLTSIVINHERKARLCSFQHALPSGEQGPFRNIQYLSPEGIRGNPLTPKSDIWSMAIVIYRILAASHEKHHPLDRMLEKDIRPYLSDTDYHDLEYPHQNLEQDLEQSLEVLDGIHLQKYDPNGNLREVIRRCLKWEPYERASAADLLTFLEA